EPPYARMRGLPGNIVLPRSAVLLVDGLVVPIVRLGEHGDEDALSLEAGAHRIDMDGKRLSVILCAGIGREGQRPCLVNGWVAQRRHEVPIALQGEDLPLAREGDRW